MEKDKPVMDSWVKAAIILGATLIVCMALYIYYSPYQRACEEVEASGIDSRRAHLLCAREL
ncbi:MAG: hypothetical protein U5L11_11740 [Arhodomonas sp.]|nr:hypothetical protein [Arhodomonas sp.]